MTIAFILLTVEPRSQDKVMKKLSEILEITEFFTVFGEWDVIAKAQVKNVQELTNLVAEKIRKIKAIKLTSTLIVAE